MPKKDIPVEEVDKGLVEPEVVQVVEETPVILVAPAESIPQAEFTLDAAKGAEWLKNSYCRLVGVFESVLFLCDGVSEDQVGFLLLLARKSLQPGGTLYAPEFLCGNISLEGMKITGGLWSAFTEYAEK